MENSPTTETSQEPQRFQLRMRRSAMASYFEVLLDCDREEAELREILDRAFGLVEDLERRLSAFLPLSDVCRLNREAYAAPVAVAPDLFALLSEARAIWETTAGAFDITVGPLVRCWGFHEREGRVPSAEELREARDRVGMEHVELDPDALTVRLAREPMELNLGAIGKGWVVDQVTQLLRREGVQCGVVQAGGSSIYALGVPPVDPRGWAVGVRPAGDEGERLGVVVLRDQALSTSGDHRQHFVAEGRRYGHVLDPRTGEPVAQHRSAASVGPSAARTDALSTAYAVMAPEETRAFCAKQGEFGILVHEDREGPGSIETLGNLVWERTHATG